MTANADSFPDPLGLLDDLVAIPSAFPDEGQIAEHLEAELQDGGFTVRRQEIGPERFNLLAEKGPAGRPAILFIGHLDTVPPPPAYGGTPYDPFKLRHDPDESVYRGLGVADMKGGLAAITAGLHGLDPGESQIKVALCVDEENISLGAHRLLQQERDWLANVKLIISADTGAVPWDNRRRFPTVMFITGRLGRFSIDVTVHGPRGHGAYADPTRSAPVEAARFLTLLDASREQLCGRHDFLGRSDVTVGRLDASTVGFNVPRSCHIRLNWLALPEDVPKLVVQRLEGLVQSAYSAGSLLNAATPIEFSIPGRETAYASGWVTPRFGPMLDLVGEAYDEVIGVTPSYTMGRGVGDENVYAEALPEVPIFNLGPKGGDLHTAEEWVDAGAVPAAARLYRQVATTFDAIGSFKPFWDALAPVEQDLVRAVVFCGGRATWEDVQAAIEPSKLNPRRVAEKVAGLLRQFFGGDDGPVFNDSGEHIAIAPALVAAFKSGLEFLDSRPADALPADEMDAMPVDEPVASSGHGTGAWIDTLPGQQGDDPAASASGSSASHTNLSLTRPVQTRGGVYAADEPETASMQAEDVPASPGASGSGEVPRPKSDTRILSSPAQKERKGKAPRFGDEEKPSGLHQISGKFAKSGHSSRISKAPRPPEHDDGSASSSASSSSSTSGSDRAAAAGATESGSPGGSTRRRAPKLPGNDQ